MEDACEIVEAEASRSGRGERGQSSILHRNYRTQLQMELVEMRGLPILTIQIIFLCFFLTVLLYLYGLIFSKVNMECKLQETTPFKEQDLT
jgi:hypothetical protein